MLFLFLYCFLQTIMLSIKKGKVQILSNNTNIFLTFDRELASRLINYNGEGDEAKSSKRTGWQAAVRYHKIEREFNF